MFYLKENLARYAKAFGVYLIAFVVVGQVFVSFAPSTAQATIPKLVNFQGRITNADGTNVTNSTYAIQFKIYDALTSGTLLWTETYDQPSGSCAKPQITAGVFNVKLGTCNVLTGVDFTTGNLYLSVNFAPTGTAYDGEMSPRKRLVSAPFAFVANEVNGDGKISLTNTGSNQLAINYDGSNSWTASVSSAGAVTFNATGASAGFLFNDPLQLQAQSDLRLGDSDSSNYVAFRAPTIVATNITWTLPSVDASGCFQSNGSGTVSIASCGVAINLWTSDIDADGYDLNDLSNILFRETAGAPAATDVAFYRDNTGDLTANVLTGKTLNLAVNGSDEYNFSSTALAMNSNNITGLGTAVSAVAALTVSSGGSSVLTLDSASGAVTIATGDAFITSIAGDPGTPADGMLWYNSSTGKYKVRESGASKILCNTTDAGCGAGGGDLDTAYDADTDKQLNVDNASGLTFDLTTTGGFVVEDNGTAFVTFGDTGVITFAPTTGEDVILNLTGNGRLDINPANYENNLGAVDVARSGSFSGVSTETANELRIAPGLTVTEPGSGTFTWNAANIDMSGIAVTAGAGTTVMNTLRLAGVSDADAGTVRGLLIDNLTSTAATEVALSIGTGWDTGISIGSGGMTVVAGALAVNSDSITSDGTTLTINAAGTVNIQDGLDVDSTIQSGSSNVGLTLATGFIDADALTLTTAADGGTGTSSGSGLIASSDGIGLLQGCTDGQVLKWVEATDTWDCATDASGSGTSKFVVKGTNENVASGTTLQDDDNLTFAVASGETWIFEFRLRVTNVNSATPDWKAAIKGATGWTCAVTMSGVEPLGAAFPQANGTDCDAAPTAIVNATIGADVNIPFQVRVQGSIVTTSAGSVTLQWAANTSGSLTVMAGSYVIAQKVGGSDLAEIYYTHDDSMESGDVVSIDSTLHAGVRKTHISYDKETLGIISTKPGLLLGDETSDNEGRPINVALSGRVPVKVTTENGSIRSGDFLTSSSVPGVAMKATKAGQVIGQALTAFDGEGTGSVLVFIKGGYFPGGKASDVIVGLSIEGTDNSAGKDLAILVLGELVKQKQSYDTGLDVSELVTDRITVGLEIIAPRAVMDSLEINSVSSIHDAIELKSDSVFFGRPYFNVDTAGFAVISKGERSVDVIFEKEYLEQPIVNVTITLNSDLSIKKETNADNLRAARDRQMQAAHDLFAVNAQYLVVNKNAGGFTIILKDRLARDVTFSWTAFAVKNARTFFSLKDTVDTPLLPVLAGDQPINMRELPEVSQPDIVPIEASIIVSEDQKNTSEQSAVETTELLVENVPVVVEESQPAEQAQVASQE